MKVLTLTINQFNTYIKNILDAEEFLANVCLVGEVTNFKMSGGHAYFDLKDASAMLSCVKFGSGDLNIKNGDSVKVYGKVNFYVKSGRLNFIVGRVEQSGLGELWQQFLALKEKLGSEGYFDEEIKKPIPRFAKKIGVVTSETGAVIRDINNVTRAKNPYTDIVVYPSKVQGVGAEEDLCAGIRYFNSRDDIDTIIIARGGGSLEDLSPFNTEKIVKEIYASKLPIISAVGHETDFTLCDFASDLRVPTPSVGAEVAVFNYFEQVEIIKTTAKIITASIKSKYDNAKENLVVLENQIIDKTKLKTTSHRAELMILTGEISNLVSGISKKKKASMEAMIGVLEKLNPLEVLKNGYGVLEKNSERVTTVKALKCGDMVDINLQDGKVVAEIKNIKSEEK